MAINNPFVGITGLSGIEALLRLIAGYLAKLIDAVNDLTTAQTATTAALTAAFPAPLTSSATWNPASVAAGSTTSTTISVVGAVLGQRTTASFSLSLQGMILGSYVSAADTVTVVLNNNTAGALDIASGTVKAWVWAT